MKKIFFGMVCLVGSFIPSSPVTASDSDQVDLLGFSDDGRYLAFETYGSSEATGTPWATIHFIDVPANKYADRIDSSTDEKKYNRQSEDVDQWLREARLDVALRAKKVFAKYQINPAQKGELVFAHMESDLTEWKGRPEVAIDYKEPKGGWLRKSVEIDLTTLALAGKKFKCSGRESGQKEGIKVTMKSTDMDSPVIVQEDNAIPISRGSCPSNYKIESVYRFGRSLVLFIRYSKGIGWEVPYKTVLAVTWRYR